MSMWTCVHTDICTDGHMDIRVREQWHICAGEHVSICVVMYMWAYAYMNICTYRHMSWTMTHMCRWAREHVYNSEHVNICVVMYMWAYAYMSICTYRHMYRWTHEHMSTCTVKHMYASGHMYIQNGWTLDIETGVQWSDAHVFVWPVNTHICV